MAYFTRNHSKRVTVQVQAADGEWNGRNQCASGVCSLFPADKILQKAGQYQRFYGILVVR